MTLVRGMLELPPDVGFLYFQNPCHALLAIKQENYKFKLLL